MRKFLQTAGVLAIFFCAGIFTSCELFGLQGPDEGESGQIGDVTYYAARNLDKLMQLMNAGQSEAHYGDTGTVIEWDIDYNYLINPTPKPTGDGYYPAYLTGGNLADYVNMTDPDGPSLWYKVELWGADGGNIDSKNGTGDPNSSVYTDEWKALEWPKDHFANYATASDLDYGWGGKGGYIAAYIKVHSGQILYFFVGGKGKDGDVVNNSGVGTATIYGFNGGGMGSPARNAGYLDGGGGGGATSLALNMAYFYSTKKTELFEETDEDGNTITIEKETNEDAVDANGNPIFKYDFTRGYKPGSASNEPGVHYSSRLLVAGGGGGAAQGHGGKWFSLHGGDGNGGFAEAEKLDTSPASNAPKRPDWVHTMSAPTNLVSNDFRTATPKFQGYNASGTGYEDKTLPEQLTYNGISTNWSFVNASSATAPDIYYYNRGLVMPGEGNGKGMDGGYSSYGGGWWEGHGGGGGGWKGGGAIFNPYFTGNNAIVPNLPSTHIYYGKQLPGLTCAGDFPTAGGNGGSNGAVSGAQSWYNGVPAPAALPSGATAVVMAPVYDLTQLSVAAGGRDPNTFRVLLSPTGYKPIEIKLIRDSISSGPGAGTILDGSENTYTYEKDNLGTTGFDGIKQAEDISTESGRTTMKGNGFIDIHLVTLQEGNSYQSTP